MKKNYEKPQIEVIEIESEGILCSSIPNSGYDSWVDVSNGGKVDEGDTDSWKVKDF